MSCKAAKRTDQYHGWECEITEGACMFLNPDSKACAENMAKVRTRQQVTIARDARRKDHEKEKRKI